MAPPVTEADVLSKCSFDKTEVTVGMWLLQVILLVIALAAPIVTWIICDDPYIIERSGSITVFCAALAEFITLRKLHRSTLANACLVLSGANPLSMPTIYKIIGWIAFVLGLLGTALWGFGSLLFA